MVARKYFICIRCTILFWVAFQKLELVCTCNFLPTWAAFWHVKQKSAEQYKRIPFLVCLCLGVANIWLLNFISYSYQPIVDYIDAQFEAYLEEELKVIRSLFSYHDTRIHVCLYFISPTGRSLKTIDLLTMRSLDSKVRLGNSSKNLSF